MTQEQIGKIVLCTVRTVGSLLLLVAVIVGWRYLGMTHDDLRSGLALINSYFPSLVAMVLFTAVGYVFYRASLRPDNDFEFVNFFKEDRPENIWKLGYFLLLVTVMWSIFALYWNEKLTTEYVVGVLAIFIVKSAVDSVGRAWGSNNPVRREQTQAEKPKRKGTRK